MIRIGLCVCFLWTIAPTLARGVSWEDYASRLQAALSSLRSATVQEREAALARLVMLLPPEEEITFGHQAIKVNNAWVHESVRAFGGESDMTRRRAIYLGIETRLAALVENVQRVRQPAGIDPQRERQQLREILSRREFQRHRRETWLGRLQHWVQQTLARLSELFPRVRRGEGPIPRLLEILVWTLAVAVLYFLIRSIYGGFRREKLVKRSGHRVILGTVIEEQATPGDLRKEALELAGQGDYRGAIRRLYISLLYELQERSLLQLDAAATNSDYLRRLRPVVAIYPLMLYLTRRFDHFWYGKFAPSESEYQEFLNQYQNALSALPGQ